MSQIFHRHTNIYSRLSILALVVFVGALGAASRRCNWSATTPTRSAFVEQPIQFSHAHHVGGMGIDCRYCHTSVEESAFANIPPTKTCMNCHSQIWTNAPILEPVRASFRDDKPLQWTRVHDLPDFVYFNHSIHVKQGVGCATCHGRVDTDAADVSGSAPDDAVVPGLPPEPGDNTCDRATRSSTWPGRARPTIPDSGERLVKEYKIASVGQLTNCSTCHR